jgi:ectoine hydroxylase-related dioxygenase (phytanoyl-CoA dioxygenase family)
LYYVCDSDGDTIIYDKKCETYKEFENMINSNTKTLNIQKKITPKQGRVVLFNGLLYHTAEQPNKDIRCIVNYDLVDLSVDSHI